MSNANKILDLERAIGILISVGPIALQLAKDVSPMPDNRGTVADRFRAAMIRLDAVGPDFGEAFDGQIETIEKEAIAAEAAENPPPPGKTAVAKPTPAAKAVSGGAKTPGTVQKPVVASLAHKAPAPGQGPAGIQPPTFRRIAGR